MVRPARIALVVLVAFTAAACPDFTPLGQRSTDQRDGPNDPPPDDPNALLLADLDVDANRDGVVDVNDDADEELFNDTVGAMFLANVDDDDQDGVRDSRDDFVSGADDLADLTLVRLRKINGIDGHTVTMSLGPEQARALVRIWRRDGDVFSMVFDPNQPQATAPLLGADVSDIELFVEGLVARTVEWDGTLELEVALSKDDETVSRDRVVLRGAPLILPDNLQAPTTVYVMNIPNGGDNNVAFVGAMQAAMPADVALYRVSANPYFGDRWVQDNMELGYQEMPGRDGDRVVMRMAINLERGYGGGLEDFVPSEYLLPNAGYLYPGGSASSHNYGGNLEVAPPVAGHPLGRLLYGGGSAGTLLGRSNSDTMNINQVGFLRAQEVQGEPLELSSEWLAVGHIDEIFQFVPDLTPDEGGKPYKVVIASPALARDTLLAVQGRGGGQLEIFAGRRATYTVDEVVDAENFAALNEAAQERIDSVQQVLEDELGLNANDFRPVPVYVIEVGGGLVAAFNPGIQNLVTVGDRLFVPDPEGPHEAGVDVWQEATRAALADTDLDVVFVDVFESYHELLGEAHCGTNVDRAPYDTAWWSL